jgi:hypothetical protein
MFFQGFLQGFKPEIVHFTVLVLKTKPYKASQIRPVWNPVYRVNALGYAHPLRHFESEELKLIAQISHLALCGVGVALGTEGFPDKGIILVWR